MIQTPRRPCEPKAAGDSTEAQISTLTAVGMTEANAGHAPVAAAEILPAHLLGGDEIVILAVKPSLWFVLFQSFRWLAAMAVVVWCVGWWGHLAPLVKTPLVVNAAVAIAAARVGLALLQWVSRLYVLTNRRVMRIKGILNVDLFECPLTKIQNTYLTLSWYERLFGLGSIIFATAGTAGFEPSWININHPLEVHDQVRAAINRAQQNSPGQML
jgi:membrane protein YdbS with pleckstrin-like domain